MPPRDSRARLPASWSADFVRTIKRCRGHLASPAVFRKPLRSRRRGEILDVVVVVCLRRRLGVAGGSGSSTVPSGLLWRSARVWCRAGARRIAHRSKVFPSDSHLPRSTPTITLTTGKGVLPRFASTYSSYYAHGQPVLWVGVPSPAKAPPRSGRAAVACLRGEGDGLESLILLGTVEISLGCVPIRGASSTMGWLMCGGDLITVI